MPQIGEPLHAPGTRRGRDAEVNTPEETTGGINAFLVADVRGYTAFTQERGDEAAARLMARFAEIVREHVEARDGSVIELRGDEALAVFRSPRQAIRAAVELQTGSSGKRRRRRITRFPSGSGWTRGRRCRSETASGAGP